jgi:hypothetical protein
VEADLTDDHVVIYSGTGNPVRRHGVAVDVGAADVPQPPALDEVGSDLHARDG